MNLSFLKGRESFNIIDLTENSAGFNEKELRWVFDVKKVKSVKLCSLVKSFGLFRTKEKYFGCENFF